MQRLIIFLFLLNYNLSFSGIPVGFWRDHLSFRRATHVAVSENAVYCSAGTGIIIFRKDDGSVEKLTRINGLSDIDISCIRWSEENNLLLIGYSNGNIDIIRNNKITNLSDILRGAILGTRSINNILFAGSKAYLSCSFGIVVVNLEKDEIAETYYLGEGGQRLAVNDMAFDGAYLYAATSGGLYMADINSPNLMDFSNWSHLDFLTDPGAFFLSLAWFDQKLYAVELSGSGRYSILQIEGSSFRYFGDPSDVPVTLRYRSNYLMVLKETEALIFGRDHTLIEKIDDYGLWGVAMRDLEIDNNGNIWIADRLHGLLNRTGGEYRILTPQGPFSNNVFSISAYPRRAYFAAGGYTSAYNNLWRNGEFSVLDEGTWRTRFNYDVRDVLYVKEHPDNPGIQFVSTWGYGVAKYHDGALEEIFNESNSTLRSIIPGGNYIRIGGMAFDKNGNLWITNSGVSEPVSVIKPDGQWISFPYGGIINHDHVGRLIINSLDQKWVLLPRGGGLFVFKNNDLNNHGRTRKLRITDETNSLISNEVYSIAEDHNGFIWVGLNNGVAVYYNPSNVFREENFHAHRIVVTGSRDHEIGYLLNNETVTSIAIDGANRKWFGTERSGVFLVSADGKKQIHHFSRQNSPLLSNHITDIAIDPATGEVYFGTVSGVVSFRGDASEPHSAFDAVYVFPNPVRENYDGPVTIAGLVRDSIVKITDISGNLVYETVSLGGQAIWDGRDFRGRRVHTGIYMVFISSPDGSQSHVTKLMYIR